MGIKKLKYEQWLKARGLQPLTISQYMKCLENMQSNVDKFNQDGVLKLISLYKGNVVRSFLTSYKTYLIRNPNLSQEQKNKVRDIDIPTTKHKKRKTPITITKGEMFSLYKKMPNSQGRILLLLSFYCGLRRAELLALKVKNFNFKFWLQNTDKMGVLTILGKGNKQGRIPVKSIVMSRVYNYLPDDYTDETLLFDMNPRTWNRVLSRVGKEAIGKHVKPHTLRHSVAMHLRGHGFAIDEIKEFLRHEDISTTQIYSRVTAEQMMEKFKTL